MCHFITLVVPTEDTSALRVVLEQYGRVAWPVDNPSTRKVLQDGERQYVTVRGHCDCGTVLVPRHDDRLNGEAELARDALRMKRKGWSDTKIARALEDRQKSDARPSIVGPDSLEMWEAVLNDLGQALSLPHAGLLVRFYSGAIATEVFNASRRQLSKSINRQDGLGSIAADEVTVFPLR